MKTESVKGASRRGVVPSSRMVLASRYPQGKKELHCRVLLKHLPDCPGQVKVRFGQGKQLLWTYDFQYKKCLFFLLGQVKVSFGQVFFNKFILCLPEWASSDFFYFFLLDQQDHDICTNNCERLGKLQAKSNMNHKNIKKYRKLQTVAINAAYPL